MESSEQFLWLASIWQSNDNVVDDDNDDGDKVELEKEHKKLFLHDDTHQFHFFFYVGNILMLIFIILYPKSVNIFFLIKCYIQLFSLPFYLIHTQEYYTQVFN